MTPSRLYKANYYFLLLAGINGLIIFSLHFFKPIKLWREAFLLFFGALLILSLKKVRLPSLILLHCLFGFAFYQSFFSNHPIIEIYQLRLDLFLPFYTFLTYEIYKDPPDTEVVRKLVKMILILGFINALFTTFEFLLAGIFLEMLNIENGNWGVHGGIRLITTHGNLRAPGLLTGFVQSGDFLLLSIFLLWSDFAKTHIYTSKVTRSLLSLLLFIGLYCTTYKTGMLGLVFFSFFMVIRFIMKRKINLLILAGTGIGFIVHFISYNTPIVYDFFKAYFPLAAERSVGIRYEQHLSIFNEMDTIYKFLFGSGYGKNGTFGLDKDGYFEIVHSLDSSFIYLLSNYGLLFLLAFLIFVTYFTLKHIGNDPFHMVFFLMYFMAIEFFVNNIFVNVPTIFILINLLILTFILQKKHDH